MQQVGLNPANEIVHSIVHVLVVGLLQLVVGLPWQVYMQFVIEERHGFNKMGPGLFVSDLVKQVIGWVDGWMGEWMVGWKGG